MTAKQPVAGKKRPPPMAVGLPDSSGNERVDVPKLSTLLLEKVNRSLGDGFDLLPALPISSKSKGWSEPYEQTKSQTVAWHAAAAHRRLDIAPRSPQTRPRKRHEQNQKLLHHAPQANPFKSTNALLNENCCLRLHERVCKGKRVRTFWECNCFPYACI